jgi:hypothetical protein
MEKKNMDKSMRQPDQKRPSSTHPRDQPSKISHGKAVAWNNDGFHSSDQLWMLKVYRPTAHPPK